MYSMPEEYVSAMRADTREIDLVLAIGVNIDQTSADDFETSESSRLPFSNPPQLIDAVYDIEPGLTTFEYKGIKTSTSAGNFAPPLEQTVYPPEYGYWSDVISDGDGVIDWTVTVKLTAVHKSAFTVFTREVAITEAYITFYVGGEVTGEGPMEIDKNSVKFTDSISYDTIEVHITRLEAPFRHVRISEIEFGASKTFNRNSLTGEVTIITERDPLMTSIPLWELDFTVLNVTGEWDQDNPFGFFSSLPPSFPVEVGLSCYSDGSMWTVPLGRFMISEKDANDTELSVTCYDPRKALQDIYESWTILASESFGDQITDLFAEIHIPHIVSDEVFELYPNEDFTSEDDDSLLDMFLWIQQYYDIYLVPERDGYIHVVHGKPSGNYGNMDPDMEYTYPLPYGFTTYNYIIIQYGPSNARVQYSLDIRASASEIKSQITIDNPMILTEERAIELAQKVRSRLYSSMVEIEWRADAMNDIGDSMGLTGRWSETPEAYECVYQELKYDGSLVATTRGIL